MSPSALKRPFPLVVMRQVKLRPQHSQEGGSLAPQVFPYRVCLCLSVSVKVEFQEIGFYNWVIDLQRDNVWEEACHFSYTSALSRAARGGKSCFCLQVCLKGMGLCLWASAHLRARAGLVTHRCIFAPSQRHHLSFSLSGRLSGLTRPSLFNTERDHKLLPSFCDSRNPRSPPRALCAGNLQITLNRQVGWFHTPYFSSLINFHSLK